MKQLINIPTNLKRKDGEPTVIAAIWLNKNLNFKQTQGYPAQPLIAGFKFNELNDYVQNHLETIRNIVENDVHHAITAPVLEDLSTGTYELFYRMIFTDKETAKCFSYSEFFFNGNITLPVLATIELCRYDYVLFHDENEEKFWQATYGDLTEQGKKLVDMVSEILDAECKILTFT